MDLARTHPTCLLDKQFPDNFIFEEAKISMTNFHILLTSHLLGQDGSVNCPFEHNMLLNEVVIRILSR